MRYIVDIAKIMLLRKNSYMMFPIAYAVVLVWICFWIRGAIGAILSTIVLLGLWWFWWWLPRYQAKNAYGKSLKPKDLFEVEDGFRKSAGQLIGGFAVLVGLAAAYVQFIDQKKSSYDTIIRNQISKGFEYLGDEKVTVRLGGIYTRKCHEQFRKKFFANIRDYVCFCA